MRHLRSTCVPLLLAALLATSGAPQLMAKENLPPPREIPLVEKKQDDLSVQADDDLGKLAFSIDPKKWKHAESENFILHYRRATEARRVIREIEYTLWYVAKALDKGRADYQKKSHVFIFSGTGDWRTFLSESGAPQWAASFARGDNLYLNIGGAVEQFDSQLLAHEVTHAVVSRLYPDKRWPLWLNEGFAEYMGSASVAARTQRTLKGLQTNLAGNTLPLERLIELERYPSDREEISQLYRNGERFVRYMMTRYPQDRFPRFIDVILERQEFEPSVMEVYGDLIEDYPAFVRGYATFDR